MITEDMWERAKDSFDDEEYSRDDVEFLAHVPNQHPSWITISITRKQVQEHFDKK